MEMVDPAAVEAARTPDYAIDFVILFQEKFSQERSVLPRDTGDERFSLCQTSNI